MTSLLPPKANGRFLHEQAKDLLKAHKSGKADACDSLRLLRRFRNSPDGGILGAQVALNEVQFALAMEYGFKSWSELVAHVEAVESKAVREESLVHPESLGKTLDAVNEALFWGRPISKARAKEAAEWIASRAGMGYAGMPAPMPQDFAEGARVFTGERVASRGGSAHILGEEACRVLRQTGFARPFAEEAYRRAASGMAAALVGDPDRGDWCCGICSCALWRHMAARDASAGLWACEIARPEQRLATGMKALRSRRDNEGRWKSFPFWYTLLALTEVELPEALEEIRYAAAAIERSRKRMRGEDKITLRRREVAERALRAV